MSPLTLTLSSYSRWLCRFKILHSQNALVAFSSTATTTTPPNENQTQSSGPAPPPIRVALTESAGRGVFATRKIRAGDTIHSAKPIVSHPSLSAIDTICYFCLKKMKPFTESQSQGVSFCCEKCKESSKVFYDVEKKADWVDFDDYCRTQGLKFPLLVKRLACMVISGAAPADIVDILQPASLTQRMILKMEEGFCLLRNAFTKANMGDERTYFLTKQWYTAVLARIRINAFRIDLAGGAYEDLLSLAAASIEAEAAVGNAIYMLPSFYNHDCDPNTHIIWIENADAKLKALRDIDEGEELRICYIDASVSCHARQSLLSQGFGFECNCLRCLSGD
ncbi:histone-lysine N-methyltransferase ATXR4 isoform X1 [Durio zibethinus]|uniref:Histone-lysine N-methyltransferase ATXR4 isoform X1 n=1 Tax=Durio zibethinus TaxID=66656 RepID=A0A6P5YV02_DURZI|nr:histone-lysine N-methyltransferase ATXR4 isoform X1 [Durio zibethinus]